MRATAWSASHTSERVDETLARRQSCTSIPLDRSIFGTPGGGQQHLIHRVSQRPAVLPFSHHLVYQINDMSRVAYLAHGHGVIDQEAMLSARTDAFPGSYDGDGDKLHMCMPGPPAARGSRAATRRVSAEDVMTVLKLTCLDCRLSQPARATTGAYIEVFVWLMSL